MVDILSEQLLADLPEDLTTSYHPEDLEFIGEMADAMLRYRRRLLSGDNTA